MCDCADSEFAPSTAPLIHELRVLITAYGRAQTRASEALQAQAAELAQLRERIRVQEAEIMRLHAALIQRDREPAGWLEAQLTAAPLAEEQENLQAAVHEADLVICQTGCLSHNAYWRVRDQCKRTGKPCVMLGSEESLRVLRLSV